MVIKWAPSLDPGAAPSSTSYGRSFVRGILLPSFVSGPLTWALFAFWSSPWMFAVVLVALFAARRVWVPHAARILVPGWLFRARTERCRRIARLLLVGWFLLGIAAAVLMAATD